MNVFYLSSTPNCVLKIESRNIDLIDQIKSSDFIFKYIPGVKFETESNIKEDVSINILDSGQIFDITKYPGISINGLRLSIKDIISLIELVFERVRQEKKIYCIHSSCALYKGRAIIFWGGASGLGKTRIAFELGNLTNGRLYSDEKTLIDPTSRKVVGGIGYLYAEKPFYKDGLFGSPDDDKYIKRGGDTLSCFPIEELVYVNVNESEQFINDLWDQDKFEWHLYEELSRKIRAISRRVDNGLEPISSIDTPSIAQKRAIHTRNFTSEVKCYYLSGSVKNILSYIIQKDG